MPKTRSFRTTVAPVRHPEPRRPEILLQNLPRALRVRGGSNPSDPVSQSVKLFSPDPKVVPFLPRQAGSSGRADPQGPWTWLVRNGRATSWSGKLYRGFDALTDEPVVLLLLTGCTLGLALVPLFAISILDSLRRRRVRTGTRYDQSIPDLLMWSRLNVLYESTRWEDADLIDDDALNDQLRMCTGQVVVEPGSVGVRLELPPDLCQVPGDVIVQMKKDVDTAKTIVGRFTGGWDPSCWNPGLDVGMRMHPGGGGAVLIRKALRTAGS